MPTPSAPPNTPSQLHIPSAVIALVIAAAMFAAFAPIVPPDIPWWAKGLFAAGGAGFAAALAVFRPPTVALVLLFVLLPFAAVVLGCGGATGATRTDYAVEQGHCIANERAIVDRTGTTLEQDQADLATERHRCDAALAAIGGAP
jgi:hypothetical protein